MVTWERLRRVVNFFEYTVRKSGNADCQFRRIARVREKFATGGLDFVLREDSRLGAPQKLDGKQEAFLVTRVHVAIYGARERVIEEGDAVSDRIGRWWTYRTQVTGSGVNVKALAHDLAENEGRMTIEMT